MEESIDNTTSLYAFDFDHTILDGNSDTEITKVTSYPLPQEVKNVYDGTNWTDFMNAVFDFLHQKGVSVKDMELFVQQMTPTTGMVSLLQEINRVKLHSNSKLLIISDANDIFISAFLTSIGVSANFIITNRASTSTTNPEGKLSLQPYENQQDCPICPKNLCKGSALSQQLKKTPFSSVIYVGDGHNDVCPGMKLTSQDFLFVRKGYSLEKILKVGKVRGKLKNGDDVRYELDVDIKAQVHFWDDAATIRDVIFG